MLDFLPNYIKYFLVALLWGITNPFIKHGNSEKEFITPKFENTHDIEHNITISQSSLSSSSSSSLNTKIISFLLKTFKNLISKFKKPKIIIPFLVNQLGSFLFYLLLSSEPISIASPVINSLTFIVTTIVSYLYFDEKVSNLYLLILGATFTLYGTYLCMKVE